MITHIRANLFSYNDESIYLEFSINNKKSNIYFFDWKFTKEALRNIRTYVKTLFISLYSND